MPDNEGTERLMGRDVKLSGGVTNGEGQNFSDGGFVRSFTDGGRVPGETLLALHHDKIC